MGCGREKQVINPPDQVLVAVLAACLLIDECTEPTSVVYLEVTDEEVYHLSLADGSISIKYFATSSGRFAINFVLGNQDDQLLLEDNDYDGFPDKVVEVRGASDTPYVHLPGSHGYQRAQELYLRAISLAEGRFIPKEAVEQVRREEGDRFKT
jgi:hypothetical protein